jgi:hypothetical protein
MIGGIVTRDRMVTNNLFDLSARASPDSAIKRQARVIGRGVDDHPMAVPRLDRGYVKFLAAPANPPSLISSMTGSASRRIHTR